MTISLADPFSVVGGAFILAAIFWFAGMSFLARDTERAPLRLQRPANWVQER